MVSSLKACFLESISLVKKLDVSGYCIHLPLVAFFAVCLLFGSEKKTKFSDSGFSDWKHGSVCITEHENSSSHCDAMLVWIM